MRALFALGLCIALAAAVNGFDPGQHWPDLQRQWSALQQQWFPQSATVAKVVKAPETTEQKIEHHLNELDQATKQAAENQLGRIRAFLRDRKLKAHAFADSALSWGGKWQYIQGVFQNDDGSGMRQFLLENFEKHLFNGEDLRAVLESAVAGYQTDVQGLENDMLVRLRADLAQDQLFTGGAPQFQSDEAFKEVYQRTAEKVFPAVAEDLKVTIGREVVLFVGSELAAQILGQGLAARLALSGGVFTTAANSGLVTLGVGLVAGFVIDYLLDWLLRLVGYDPAGQLAGEVRLTIDRMGWRLIDGDSLAIDDYARFRRLERNASSQELRSQYRAQAEQIAQSGALGLRIQFQGMHELQSRLRRQAIRKLTNEARAMK